MGRMMGLEPTNTGTTIRGLNHLATPAIFRKKVILSSGIHIVTKWSLKLKPRKCLYCVGAIN